ncbi:MAG: YciI family protein [Mycobacteriales bacterium]
MTRYLISFPPGAMDHIPEEEMPDVDKTAHAVVEEAKNAGIFVFAGGLDEDVDPVTVAGDGTVTTGTYPLGGITVIDVPSRGAALEWATKIATACRCPQEVSAVMPDPAVGN